MNPAPMVIPRISRSLAPLAAIDELLAAGCFADARRSWSIRHFGQSRRMLAREQLRAHCVLRRAFCELAVSHNENALISAREAADIFCDLEDLSFESAALACCSVAAARLGLSFEAIESALRARRISDQSGDIPGEVQACLALGHAYAWDPGSRARG